MPGSKIAIKRLAASDLTYFAAHFSPARTHQKGLNLNSDVFIHTFYPGFKGRTEAAPFPLTIIGPAGRPPHTSDRKAKLEAKNWRLDGTLIEAPANDPDRYDLLQPGDFGIMAFEGDDLPRTATLILVSAQLDAVLHAAIASKYTFVGRRTMLAVSQQELNELLDATPTSYPGSHPLQSILAAEPVVTPPDTIEEAVFGPAAVQDQIAQTNGLGAAVTQEKLRQQLRAAEDIGEQGEAAFEQWLLIDHTEQDFVWVSRTHARAARDFDVTKARWQGANGTYFVDVKATRGPLELPIHMSLAEVRWASTHANYRIARVHHLTDQAARITMLAGIHEVATSVLDTLAALPQGVRVDSFEIRIDRFIQEFTVPVPLPPAED